MTEAVKIAQEGVNNILNSKNEFGCNNLPEITIQYGNIRGAMGPTVSKRRNQAEGIPAKKRKPNQDPEPESQDLASNPTQATRTPTPPQLALEEKGPVEGTRTHSEDTGGVTGVLRSDDLTQTQLERNLKQESQLATTKPPLGKF